MSDEDAYARALARIAASQIVFAQVERVAERSAAGVQTATKSRGRNVSVSGMHATTGMTDVLADVLSSFVMAIGRRARARAELSGRTKCALPDVEYALEGTARAARTNTRDLAQYARYERIKFPRTVPKFPATSRAKRARDDDDNRHERLRGAEPWMPPLPPAHTYIRSPPVVAQGAPRAGRADYAAQRRAVEQSLAQLQGTQATIAKGPGGNPFFQAPRTDDALSLGDEEPRAPPEPFVPRDVDRVESNRVVESDAKRARIERVLKEPGAVTGLSAAQLATGSAEAKTKTSGTPAKKGGGKTKNWKKGGSAHSSSSSAAKSGASKSKSANGGSMSDMPEGLVPLSASKKV